MKKFFYLTFLFTFACSVLPSELPGAKLEDFKRAPNATGAEPPAVDPFAVVVEEVATATKFAPQLTMEFTTLKAGSEPGLNLSVYQTKGELEIKETQTLLEGVTFNFGKLRVGQEVGRGKMEVGTPPKLTLDLSITVTSTDNKGMAILAAKASNAFAKVYVADLLIEQGPKALSITSKGNATQANSDSTNIASVRLTQNYLAEFLRLPAASGLMRTRTVFVSELDASTSKGGQKVFSREFSLE